MRKDIKHLPKPIRKLAQKRRKENPCKGMIFGFEWETTKEGHNFWMEIDSKNYKPFYEMYLKKKKKTSSKPIRKAIYWSTADFEIRAETNFDFLKEHYADEYKTFDIWEQLYDQTKFPKMLKKMIKNHDATVGITWDTIDLYLGKTEKKILKKSPKEINPSGFS